MIIIPLLFLAAVGGSPLPPQPGAHAWLAYSNDDTLVHGPDDYRTGGAAVGVRIHEYVLSSGYDVLTDKNGGTRSDEWTTTVSQLSDPVPTGNFGSYQFAVGLGARASGNLGGAEVQNGIHRALGVRELHLEYAPRRVWPAFTGAARWGVIDPSGLRIDASASVVGCMYVEGEGVLRIGLGDQKRFLWVAPTYQLRAKHTMSVAEDHAWARERGVGFETGVAAYNVSLQADWYAGGGVSGTFILYF